MKFKTAMMAATIILLSATPVLAHKVNIFAYSEGDTIFTESYFPDGRKVQGGRVEVYDSKEAKLLEGTTDDKGVFNFKAPKKDDLKIVLIATMGHKNFFVIKADEIEAIKEAAPKETSPPAQDIEKPHKAVDTSKPRQRVEPPEQSHIVPALIGLGIILGLTYLIMHFTKKDDQKKS